MIFIDNLQIINSIRKVVFNMFVMDGRMSTAVYIQKNRLTVI